MRALTCVIYLILGLSAFGMAVKPNPLVRSGIKPNLLIPLFIYPHSWGTTEIQRLLPLPKKYPNVKIVVIANVDFDSVDWQKDFNYRVKIQGLLRDLSDAGVIVIGYVSSSYTGRPIQGNPTGSGFGSDIKTNIDRWITTFPQIRGIFVDEMCYSLPFHEKLAHPCVPFEKSKATLVAGKQPYRDVLTFYRTIYKYVRETRGLELVIANPGQAADKAFFDGTIADNIVTFEGSELKFDPTNPETFPFNTPSDMTGILIYNDAAPFAVEKLRAMLGKVSLVYFTDDMLTHRNGVDVLNPWDTLPRYLEELVAYLASPNP